MNSIPINCDAKNKTMALNQKADLHETRLEIPTLNNVVEKSGQEKVLMEKMVSNLAEDLQATLHQHLYQTMVKTMHQVVNDESHRLSEQIMAKLQAQIPDIIESACQKKK